MSQANEQVYFDCLKRIASYMEPDQLRNKAEKLYGVSGEEAIEMAYENVIADARAAIARKRRPKN